MEKIRVGLEMSTRWTDPPIMIMVGIIGSLVGALFFSLYFLIYVGILYSVIPWIGLYVAFQLYAREEAVDTTKYFTVKAAHLKKYESCRIPISTLYEAYILEEIDIKGDVLEFLNQREHYVSYKITLDMMRHLLIQFFPSVSESFHKLQDDKNQIAAHYDRGNDFFNSFLGETMVYTSAVFHSLSESLKQAQENKMSLICDKLQLAAGEKILDIGCGWGTLARHAAKHYQAHSTGVTLSVEGAAWCEAKNKEEEAEVQGRCRILCRDYRLIDESEKYDKISSIEMAEHVGLANFQIYLAKVKSLLKPQGGMFLMQVAGLRQGANWEDVAWGLFMSKYIFPGADASTPLNWYIRQLELAGFEVRSVETIGRHYSHTLHRWYDLWLENAEPMKAKYGERLYRLWAFFLAWSVVAAGQGSATCYQILCHPNTSAYDRDIFIGRHVGSVGVVKKTE